MEQNTNRKNKKVKLKDQKKRKKEYSANNVMIKRLNGVMFSKHSLTNIFN